MEESMKLNWILIDPVKKRAANISSRDAVSAKRNWLTGDLEIRFSTVVTGKSGGGSHGPVVWIGGDVERGGRGSGRKCT
ncbi:hypothetical protein Bca52824_045719 [Brassica carinata]|uniref:Uncharacterized protein n=1 Tax=Brassica carinata TaxID=52824 RepID=A0A8X7RD26_BRACI|nr:hypothetical protein Bca52824_045719 [Brassica carinata]